MRANTRIRSRINVKYQILSSDNSQAEIKTTIAKDISTDGIHIEVERSLRLDTKIKLEFRLPKIEQPINAIGRVVRVEEVSIQAPEYARIRASVNCAFCGERVMETRARIKDGKMTCIPCAEGQSASGEMG